MKSAERAAPDIAADAARNTLAGYKELEPEKFVSIEVDRFTLRQVIRS